MTPATLAAIATALGQDDASVSAEAVAGGDSHAAFAVTLGTERVFVKTNTAACTAAFAAEAEALAAIAATATVRVPAVLARGTHANTAWLALEWLPLAALCARSAGALGERLAALHRATAETHGWHSDNWLGASLQRNKHQPDWASFWRDQRLEPQLTALARTDKRLAEFVGAAIEPVLTRLADHEPPPSLLHGDLWGGNAAAIAAAGEPVIFDPASYYGDRETDLAMTRLFGAYPREFYAAYQATWPLPADAESRVPLYNLYHALNHANLFGAAYASLVSRCANDLK